MNLYVLGAFRDELVKIAQDEAEGLEYKELDTPEGKYRLAKNIPLFKRFPHDPDLARQKIMDVIATRDIDPVLGYKNIAISKAAIPDPEQMGFSPTSLATPLPGESMFSTSWRRGRTHIHGMGPVYLAHRDKHAPMDPDWGYFNPRAARHFVTEGIPSLVKRYTTERNTPLVERVEEAT